MWRILLFLFSLQVQAALTFNNGFESGGLSGFTCSGNCPTVTTGSKFSGTYGGNFDLTRAMSTNYRTEVDVGSFGRFAYNQEYWFGVNYKHVDWVKDSSPEIGPIQVHSTPSTWGSINGVRCALGNAVDTAPFVMMSQNGALQIRFYKKGPVWQTPLVAGQWHSVVFHFRMATNSTGFVEAWIDGNKVVRVDGATGPVNDMCGQPMKEPFFKMGVYKWDWKTKVTQSSRRLLYLDNLKIFSGADGYSSVYTPVNTGADTTGPVLSNIASTPSSSGATITWSTNEASTTKVDYGLTTSYGSVSNDASLVSSHSASLTGLAQNTLYHYKVTSVDAAGNSTPSADQTFTTSATDITPPVVSSVSASSITTSSAVITWTTNESSDSQVNYGLTTGYGSTKSDLTRVTSHSITLTGLSASTLYHYKVFSKDASNNTGFSGDLTFTTATPDTTKPTISNVASGSITGTSAVITFNTNESALGRVDYGVTTSYGSNRTETSYGTSHSLTLTGLTPGTLYHYQVSAKDAANNNGIGTDKTFTTLDTVAPTISSVSATAIGETTATIGWTTNEASDSKVDYGLTTGYGSVRTDATSTLSHSLDLTGLVSNTLYHYKVTSKDAANNSSSLADKTFTTANPADVTDPVISSVSSAPGTTTATITWTTDEAANSRVDYGVTSSFGSNATDAGFVTAHSVTLSNLSQGTTYYFKVTSEDSSLNASESILYTFTTGTTDTTAPTLSSIVITPSATGASITWVTNEASDSLANYGTTTAYGLSKSNASMVTNHSLSLTGLSEKTLYNIRLYSKDASDNIGQSANLTFTTLDGTAPTISNIQVSALDTQATITFNTNEAATSRIDYGTTTAYGANKTGTSNTSHSFTLTGLSLQTYHYKITVTDSSGNAMESADFTFSTQDIIGPVISSVQSSATDTTITYSWNTDELSSSRLRIDPGALLEYDPELTLTHSLTKTGLNPDTAYTAKISSQDASGNWSEISNLSISTIAQPKPILSNIMLDNLNFESFTVKWDSDIASTTKVEYGLTTSYGSTYNNADPVTSHTAIITGLDDLTDYHYRVCSTATLEQCSADQTLTTDPVPVAVISNVVVSPTKNTATITWTTDINSDSIVYYGVTGGLGSTEEDLSMVTSHSVTITGLTPKTRYYFKVGSTSAGSATESASGLTSFTTLSGSGLKSKRF